MKRIIILSVIIINGVFAQDIKDQVVVALAKEGEEIIKMSLLERDEKYLIVKIMSTDCRTCIASMPAMLDLKEETFEQAKIKTVAIDRVLELDNVFFEKQAAFIIYPFIFDRDREVARMFGLQYTPTIYVLDQENNIIFKHVGLLEAEMVEKMSALVRL